MTNEACESKLCSDVRSFMLPCPRNWVAIGHAVMYYVRAAHTFSVGIKFRDCTYTSIVLIMAMGYCGAVCLTYTNDWMNVFSRALTIDVK